MNDPQRKTYCPLPRLLLLRERPSSRLWKTEGNDVRKYTLNKNQSLPCWRWWHLPLFFLRQFLHLILLLLLYHSGKIAIPRYHLFILLWILHLFLFKSLHRQGEMSISGDNRVVVWWARYGNCRLSFLKRADIPLVWNVFVAIYFWPIFILQFLKVVLLMMQQCSDYCVVIGCKWTSFKILVCAIELVDSAQCKCKYNNDFCFSLSCELVGWPTIAKHQALKIVYHTHAGAVEGVLGEGWSVSCRGARTKGEVHNTELINKTLLYSDLLTSLSSSFTPLFLQL